MDVFTYEALFLRAGLEQLKAYLFSDELFWNLGLRASKGFPPYPQLSLGNLLLSEARIAGLVDSQESSTDQYDDANAMITQLAELRKEWQVAWAAKAEKEFGFRLRQWTRNLAELSSSPTRETESYANLVRIRALLEFIGEHLPESATSMLIELSAQDKRLKALTISGDFVWEKEYEAGFPREDFWYLYVQPKSGQ